MQILYLTGDVNKEMAEGFVKEFSKIPITDHITVYINTDGGDTSHAGTIIDIINNNKDRIVLVASGYILSAGFNIFFFSECKRRIVEDTVGMVHFSWCTFELDEAGRPKSDIDKFMMVDMRRNKAKTLRQFANIGLNIKEISRIKKGEEVYLTNKRLNQLLRWRKK